MQIEEIVMLSYHRRIHVGVPIICLFVSCLAGHLAAGETRTKSIPRFGVFETSFRHAGEYENPYIQLEAVATLTRPSGGAVKINLFWDGNDVWKLRFAPDETGVWKWAVSSRDAGLSGKSGAFNCVASRNKGGIHPMAGHPEHFQHQDGTPFWLFGDTHWSAFGIDLEEGMDRAALKHYADVRSAQGFNFVSAILTSPGVNEGGPFFHDKKTEQINPAYYREVDVRINYLNSKGITVMLFINWSNPQNYIQVWQTFPSDEACLRFTRYVTSRYSACNVCFGVTGEWDHTKDKRDLFCQMGRIVQKNDPHGRMITIHSHSWRASVREFVKEPWMSFGDYQQNYRDLHKEVLLSRGAGKPVVNGEYGYHLRDMNGDGVIDKAHSDSTQSMRHASYDIAMAGSYFVTGFGATYWGGYRDPDRFNPTNPKYDPWIEDAGHIRKLFSGLPWWTLSPHDEYISGSGIVYCLADPGKLYLIYVRQTDGPIELSLPEKSNKTRFRVERFDPRTGGYQRLSDHESKGPLVLKAPTKEDYVFVIASVSGSNMASSRKKSNLLAQTLAAVPEQRTRAQ